MIRQVLTAILLVGAVSSQSDLLDCSGKSPCFGSTTKCDPNTDCDVLFQFDQQGNLDVQVRDFADTNGYVAILVNKLLDGYNEYLICIPHEQRRVRAVAAIGNSIQITEEHMARYVRRFSHNDFRCTFMVSELPKGFSNQSVIVATKGSYTDNVTIPYGELYMPIESDDVYIHRIAAAVKRSDAVITPEERKITSDLLAKINRMARNDDDFDPESLLGKKEAADELDEDLNDMLDSEKKYSTHRRQERKEKSRRRTDDDEDEDEEPKRRVKNTRPSRYEDSEEEDDEDVFPVKKSERPPRRYNSEDDEDLDDEDDDVKPRKTIKKPKRKDRKQKGSDEEEYDVEENDDYEDSNASIHAKFSFVAVSIMFFFI